MIKLFVIMCLRFKAVHFEEKFNISSKRLLSISIVLLKC